MPTLPAFFIGHGSPMNTLESNRYTQAWRELGAAVPRPRAILAISAHWYVGLTAVTAMPRPRTIHDFFGFPAALNEFEYPAAGDPELAAEVAEAVKPLWCGLDRDAWGLDHGTWSVLAHMFPQADIPVLQLSLNATKPFDYHFDLGTRLAPLREQGVLIVSSGNVVHNLRLLEWDQPDHGADWAMRFDEAARELITSRPEDAASLAEHPDYERSAPISDHFLPLLYFAGLAAAAGHKPSAPVTGYFGGSLSMTCYGLDAPNPGQPDQPTGPGSAPIPDPARVPPDQSNI